MRPENTSPGSNAPLPSRAGGFFDGFARFLIALFPYALGIGVVTIKLPEWALMLTQLWGPGFVILGLLALGIPKYFPPNAVRDLISAQVEQADSMRTIVHILENLTGPTGEMATLREEMNRIAWTLGVQGKPRQTGNGS